MRLLSLKEINKKFNTYGLNITLTDDQFSKLYKGETTKLPLECERHHIINKSLASLRNNPGCSECNKETKRNKFLVEVIKKFSDNGYSVIDISGYKNESSKLVIKCDTCGIEHEKSYRQLRRGYSCFYCEKKSRTLPVVDIIAKFKEKNFTLLDINQYKNNQTKLDVICDICNCRHMLSLNALRLQGCPTCYDKRRRISFSYFKKELENKGNKVISVDKDYIDTLSVIKIECPNGHIRENVPHHLLRNKCKECNRLDKTIPFYKVKEIIEDKGFVLLSDNNDYINLRSAIKIKCPKGHEYETFARNFTYYGFGCPTCNLHKEEQELLQYIRNNNINYLHTDRNFISPKELDIILPDYKIAIEYCSLYYHSENVSGGRRDKHYHKEKLVMCKERCYRLVTIFGDEYTNKKAIVYSRLSNILKINKNIIYARQCNIKQITKSESKNFLITNHIQGNGATNIALGAFFDNEIIAVMVFSKPSIAKGYKKTNGIIELNRYCSKINYTIVGIASKLLAYFERHYEWNKIISYADRRWSEGDIYYKLGFDIVGETQPNYWYVVNNGSKRIHRFALRKKPDEPKNKTEWELRQEQGYDRIWDCGSLKFEKVNNDKST